MSCLTDELEVSSLPGLSDEDVAHVVFVPQRRGCEGLQVARLLGEQRGRGASHGNGEVEQRPAVG